MAEVIFCFDITTILVIIFLTVNCRLIKLQGRRKRRSPRGPLHRAPVPAHPVSDDEPGPVGRSPALQADLKVKHGPAGENDVVLGRVKVADKHCRHPAEGEVALIMSRNRLILFFLNIWPAVVAKLVGFSRSFCPISNMRRMVACH